MTTDNLPAVIPPSREVARADVDSWTVVASDVIRLANLIAPTEFVPKALRDSAPATAAAILYGREVGLGPMTALTMTHVIDGRPAMAAEAMRGLIYAAGHELHYDESTGARCVVRGRRFGTERWTVLEWTIDQARQAGLLSKDNWKKYPRAMLVARATADIARLVFPDVIHGFRAVEEFDDVEAEPEAATPGTRVTRAKKAAAKKATPAPLEQRERPAISGPPLPGEEGYEQTPVEGGAPAETLPGSGPEQPDTSPAETEEPAGDGEGEAPEPAGSEVPIAPPGPKGPRLANRAQMRAIFAALKDIGVADDDDERHLIATTILGRPVDTFKTLTIDDAKTLLDTFARVKDMPELTAVLDEFEARRTATADRWNEGDRS